MSSSFFYQLELETLDDLIIFVALDTQLFTFTQRCLVTVLPVSDFFTSLGQLELETLDGLTIFAALVAQLDGETFGRGLLFLLTRLAAVSAF